MKKLFITLAAIFAISTVASAQLYVGGSVGFGTISGSVKDFSGTEAELVGTTSFNFTPRIGYFTNDKLSFGVLLDINYLKQPGATINGTEWVSTTSFGLAPYMRYAFLTFGKFAVNLDAGIGFSYSSNNWKDKPSAASVTSTTFEVFARPVLTYDLTKSITLETSLNFCNLGFSTTTNSEKEPNNDNKASVTTTYFGLGVDADDALSFGGNSVLTIGFSYKF